MSELDQIERQFKEIKHDLKNFLGKLKVENEQLQQENENLKQCLDEIERIANAIVYGTHFTNDIEGHLKELTKQILQLIKQAKEGRE